MNRSVNNNTRTAQTEQTVLPQLTVQLSGALVLTENSCHEAGQGSPVSADVRFSVVENTKQGSYGVNNLRGAIFRNPIVQRTV